MEKGKTATSVHSKLLLVSLRGVVVVGRKLLTWNGLATSVLISVIIRQSDFIVSRPLFINVEAKTDTWSLVRAIGLRLQVVKDSLVGVKWY